KTAQDKRDNKVKGLSINAAARDNKIKALKENHDKFVQANATKLAQLKSADQKAYNDLKAKIDAEANKNHNVQIGDHTITLPKDHQKVDDKGTKSNENTQKTESDDKKANNPANKENKTTNPVVKKNSATKDTKAVETSGRHKVAVPTTKVTTENDTAHVTATPADTTTKVMTENDTANVTATPAATTAKVEHATTPVATTTKVTTENDTTNVTATPIAATTKVEHATTPVTHEEIKHAKGKLPQTGNATTQLGVLGLIAGAFGLGLAGRKRNRQDN